MRDHQALINAAGAAVRRIERLEHGLVVAVSEREGCAGRDGARCGDRRWDNTECECAAKARQYVPVTERN